MVTLVIAGSTERDGLLVNVNADSSRFAKASLWVVITLQTVR